MKVRYMGQTSFLELTHDRVYEVMSIEGDWYRIVDETGEEFALIRLLARRCVIALSGSAAAEKALKRFKIDPLSGRDPLKRHADRRGMRLTEYRQADILAIAAAHNQSPFSC